MIVEDLAGKTALVTGASSGLGLHFAELLAAQGAHVVLAARNLEALGRVVDGIRIGGGKADALQLDVTAADDTRAAIAALPGPIDILVNNAGISGGHAAIDQPLDEFDAVIDTNLKGVFVVAQAVAQRMRTQPNGGAIVNIASILGIRVAGHLAAYAASKAAVVQLTATLALEWARYRIRVNALCPGYIETPINSDFFATDAGKALINRIPSRRLGKPSELDGPLLLLCSEAGSYMTGATLAVDGGHLVSSL